MNIKVLASGSSGNAYRISDGTTSLLLDAGIPYKRLREALNFEVHCLSGCLITHCHGDHSKAAKEIAKAGVNIYTSKGTIDACMLSGHRIKTVQALSEVKIGTFNVLPFDVQHDAPEPLGFLIYSTVTREKLVYFTDTYYIKYRFDKLTHIMGECNYCDSALRKSVENGVTHIDMAKRLYSSHMNLTNFMGILNANDLSLVKQIYVLHLSDNNSDEQEIRTTISAVTSAEVIIC